MNVAKRFEEAASTYSERIALSCRDESITYQILNERANQMARHLISLGVHPNCHVGLACERSFEMIIAILAILKAGAVYVPIDVSYPLERKRFIIEDAGISYCIAQKPWESDLYHPNVQFIFFGDESRNNSKNLELSAASSVAYIYYTSGSTGKPKGVQIPHEGILRLVCQPNWMTISPSDCFLQLQNISFDGSTFEIWGALLNGAQLSLFRSGRIDLNDLAEHLIEKKVTIVFLTTRLFNLLVEEKMSSMNGLRFLITGGESMSPRHARMAFHALQDCKIYNAYGPTENTAFTTIHLLTAQIENEANIPIGLPINDTTVFIMDNEGNLVPQGIIGELCTGGKGLSIGYLNRESLNREKFIPNPYGTGNLYRTGDLASCREDGCYLYHGRIDHQVKIRGFRVEIGEVEATLRENHAIIDCAVVTRENFLGHFEMAAYVQPRDSFDSSLCRKYLEAKLPEYMIPAHIFVLKQLPLTSNGKIDRNALLNERHYKAEGNLTTEMEVTVAKLWQELFGWQNVCAEDNFFQLGGDSLGAMKFVSSLQKIVTLDITLDLVFQFPVLKDFAAQLKECKELLRSIPKCHTEILSFNQEALWIEDLLVPGSTHYAIPFAFHLKGQLDQKRFENAIGALFARHDILRTRYSSEGKPIVEKHYPNFYKWQKAANLEDALQQLQSRIEQHISLENGPAAQFCIFAINEQEFLLLFYAHHILIDDFAVRQLFHELTLIYESKVLEAPKVQYIDFSCWQRDFLKTALAQKQIKYWKSQLKDAPDLLELPWDKMRPSQLSRRGETCQLTLEADIVAAIDDLAKKHQVSKFVVFLSCYFVLLHRYSGKTDILVGSPFANRNHPDLEHLVGFCSQMMVLRADLSENISFAKLIEQVSRLVIEAQENVDIPFEKVVSELNPQRNASYNPLFQTGFGYESTENLKFCLPAVQIEPIDVFTKAAKFDLYFTVRSCLGSISCCLEFSTDLFKASTIQRMLGDYKSLLKNAAQSPQSGISSLPILPCAPQFLKRNYPKITIHRRFEEIAERFSSRIAICYKNQTVTYLELNKLANRLARHLQTIGVRQGDCVGVSLDRSPELIISFLAILKAGAIFVPIDTAYPTERKQSIIEDSDITFTLTEDNFNIPSGDSSNLLVDSHCSSLSHIFYTSGSTGKPKGVMLNHQGVINLVYNSKWFAVTEEDRVLQFSSICFDLMISEIWGALLNGAALCIYSAKEVSLQEIGRQIERQQVTHAIFTPRVLNLLIEEQLPALKRLRYLVSAGEAMSFHHAKIALEALPNCTIVNGYGPTETNFATAYLVKAIREGSSSIPIGKPIDNMTVYLLNEFLQLVPVGAVGELYIGGDGLALGYRNRDELTKERFIANPFGEGKLYKTGDLCRLQCDGNLLFVGRKDTQVKVRGFRVELGEIEEVLKSMTEVRDCFVLAKGDHLHAFVVYENEKQPKILEEYAAARLPGYMVPSSFTAISKIPLTSNGKVNAKELPVPAVEQSRKFDLLTDAEMAVAKIWARILNLQSIFADDHFFKLGGSSIQAIQLVSSIKKELQLDIPMNLIFQFPKLKDFASQIILKANRKESIEKRDSLSEVRMPWNQESFWQIDVMHPNSSNYTMITRFQFDGDVNISAMEKAVNKIISRHEALRTRFEDKGEYRVQVIESKDINVFKFTDFSLEKNPEEIAESFLESVFATPFKLTKLPLIEVHLIKIDSQKFLGALYVHHIVFDGWSIGVFFKEWRNFYRAFLNNETIEESIPKIQHPDFVCWQNEFLQSKEAKKQIRYWQKQIRGTVLINLPCDFPRQERFQGGGDIVQRSLPCELSQTVKTTAKEIGVTLYEFILAAYKVLLAKYSGQTDLLIGSPFANRTKEELEPLLGFFIHMFAIRTKIAKNDSFAAYLAKVSKAMANAYENCDVPCEAIFAELYPDWNPTFNRFQLGFSLDTLSSSDEEFEGLKTTWSPKTNTQGKFDFYLGVLVDSEQIHFNMYYCTDIYLRLRVEKMVLDLQNLLHIIVKNPHQKIKTIFLV